MFSNHVTFSHNTQTPQNFAPKTKHLISHPLLLSLSRDFSFDFSPITSMAATIPCHYYASAATTSKFFISNNAHSKRLTYPLSLTNARGFRGFSAARCSYQPPPHYSELQSKDKGNSFSLKQCAISIALAVGLMTGVPALGLPANAHTTSPVLPDLAVLISGPPIKDPGALLRYALPIDNKAIREVQKPLEDITDSLKVAGVKALDSVERNVRQASRALKQGKTLIVTGLAESKKEHGIELLNKLEAGMDELELIIQDRNRDAVAPKQKELLNYVGGVEEDMVNGFPYEVPEEYRNMPLLKGRAAVDMKVKIKDNPNLEECVFHIVLDGYNAPVTAGNFVDLVERHFYDGMEIQRADGFVVQTGDPEGPAEGFIDPSTEKTRTIPLEIMVNGEKEPFYGATLEELGLYKAQTKLPFNAFGTMAMARDEFENNSGSSQIFWLLKESELTPSNANILDGRYAVFGYVTENEDFLADLKVGDVIESMQVVSGLDNLVNPSYKIAG
ncbi:Peptidyl-prolyl cis-trans isomerase CYP38 [Arachis hypogaea]|nr:Peptidyl-prolyl cis-trans isomerase CYP38 [Arachis hypogaea]